jgi:hypothetical protein
MATQWPKEAILVPCPWLRAFSAVVNVVASVAVYTRDHLQFYENIINFLLNI